VKTCDVIPTREQISAVLPSLIGDIEIEVPRFSAVHINGKRAYDLARKGVDFVAPKRIVHVFDFKLCTEKAPIATFEITCSTGTYIRSLAKLIAEKLGTVAIAKTITRVAVGYFKIGDAKDLQTVSRDDIMDLCLHHFKPTRLPKDL